MITRTNFSMVIGAIVFLGTCTGWYFGELHGINTVPLLAFAIPVVGALFLAGPIGTAATAAQQAANQTNGMLDARIENGVAAALAKRDAARTWQAQQAPTTVPPTPSSADETAG